jgi:eukaryotic-like serine/threonine-protein kinase
MPLAIGIVLNNRYRIVGLLGQGGFGAVYRAFDQNMGKPVAIKENLDTSLDAQRQFWQEAQILSNLRHPNLPLVTDYFVIQGIGQYLVMDFIEGEDLQEKLDRAGGPLPEEQVLPWIDQVCDALIYLHSQTPPIIHRDVKPANIRITPSGKAVLVDFGISKVFDPAAGTAIGARAYSSPYSPPEQYGQGRTDARSDIYALGITLYTVLTGQEPPESVQRQTGVKMIPPRQLTANVSPAIESAILQACELDMARRFQSMTDLRWKLRPQRSRIPTSTLLVVGLLLFLMGTVIILNAVSGITWAPAATPARTMTVVPTTPIPLVALPSAAIATATSNETLVPNATRRPTVTPQTVETPTAAVTATPPCSSNEYYDPVMGRCRGIGGGEVTASATPACKSNEFYDPVMGRCRGIGGGRTVTVSPPTARPTMAPVTVFGDNFNGSSLDSSKWTVENNSNPIVVSNGALQMASSSNNYPYIHSRYNPFPLSANFRLKYRLRYPQLSTCGVGVMMTSYVLPSGFSQNDAANFQQANEQNGVAAGIWQDDHGVQIWYRSGADRVDVPVSTLDTSWHEVTIEYSDSYYKIYLDSRLIFPSLETPYRPQFIWMGHPANLGSNCSWSSLEIDYVTVESLP